MLTHTFLGCVDFLKFPFNYSFSILRFPIPLGNPCPLSGLTAGGSASLLQVLLERLRPGVSPQGDRPGFAFFEVSLLCSPPPGALVKLGRSGGRESSFLVFWVFFPPNKFYPKAGCQPWLHLFFFLSTNEILILLLFFLHFTGPWQSL